MTKTIRVEALARVEGEGGLFVEVDGDRVREVRLDIFEPPRFFEALLRGRDHREAPDITARICGICPVAYQLSAVRAMEDALSVTVSPPIEDLRRLFHCGEWIQSHALHVFMLHAPDFLGFDSAFRMADEHPFWFDAGLELKRAGNDIIRAVGGREVHPINARVGGWHRTPSRRRIEALREPLERARELSEQAVRWVAGFDVPCLEARREWVSLHHPGEYAMNWGRIVSSEGLDAPVREVFDHIVESQVPHSTALHATRSDGGVFGLGPMARFAANFGQLLDPVKALAREVGAEPPIFNPFRSIVVRALEIRQCIEDALELVRVYRDDFDPHVAYEPRAGVGWGAVEAPRGLLVHRYEVDEAGDIGAARIVPPTAQNQKAIEADLKVFVEEHLETDAEQLQWHCEQVVRNHDPCISCATHFLRLHLQRTPSERQG